jgi:hypothetical protein
MKIPPVKAGFLNAESQTDSHEDLIVAFRNFSNAPKKFISYLYSTLQTFRQAVILYGICPHPEPDQVNSQRNL